MSQGLLKRRKRFDLQKRKNLRFQLRSDWAEFFRVAAERFVAEFLVFVDGAEDCACFLRIQSQGFEVVEPKVAITEPHIEILLGQSEGAQALDEQRDQLDFRLRTRFAEDISVELMETTAAAFLHPLVPIELSDTEPFDRPLERAGLRPHQPANGWRHLRAQRHLAPALVGEAKKLGFNLVSRLALIKIERLQDRSIVFGKAKCAGRLPPEPKDVISTR